MAAGEGTRMRSSLPKVMHWICGRAMVAWPVLAAREAGADRVALIVSPKRTYLGDQAEGAEVETIVQEEANGTGGAMRAALDVIRESETVIVPSGDVPLITAETIAGMLATHRENEAQATVLTFEMDDPAGYGRIVRDESGDIAEIVETKHTKGVVAEVLALKEINSGSYIFEAEPFAAAIEAIGNDNAAGEYYLGDVMPLLREAGHRIVAHVSEDANVNLGVNTRADLAVATAEAQKLILRRHMLAGVMIIDPSSTWIEADVEIAQDVTLEPGTYLRGLTRIGAGTTMGPHTTVEDSIIGRCSSVVRSHLDAARVGDGCNVGPFSYLRPGARLGDGAKVGAFVEVKNSEIGEGAKVPHLSYVGDADIGAGANLGAGTITANYDGFTKNRTTVGPGARVSVNTSLVAPVDVGEGAYTGAGAVIREDVPPGALGVSKAEQRNIEGYAERKAAAAKKNSPEEADDS
ncbi:bifunctional UDP-N-acetylglucosamine diphosphorylase/glucosamine-1-phosphate N-acetyltransferase GlmU [soil metagenome]